MNTNPEFNVSEPKPKTYFDLPPQEIYLFYNDQENSWYYELVDNMTISLKYMTQGNDVIKICNSAKTTENNIFDYMQNRFPNAKIEFYASQTDWITDREQGCYR